MLGITRIEFDCIEPNSREKYEYNYDRIFNKEKEMPASEIMRKFYAGTLKSGSGKKVTSLKQAKAIAASYNKKEKGKKRKK